MSFPEEDVRPFGVYRDFADCVRKLKAQGMPEEEAVKECDRLQSEHDRETENDEEDPLHPGG
jgi:hypothetical protein